MGRLLLAFWVISLMLAVIVIPVGLLIGAVKRNH